MALRLNSLPGSGSRSTARRSAREPNAGMKAGAAGRKARATLLLLFAILAPAQTPRFEKDILPIFTANCFICHGKSSPKLGLDLRTAAAALRGSHNGAVIVPGSLDKSLLWQKVSQRQMPPEAFK